MRRAFPVAQRDGAGYELIQFTESFDYLATLSPGERVSLVKRLMASKRIEFLKYLALPELLKSRKLTRSNSSAIATPSAEISLEVVQFLFVKGKELITMSTPETQAVDDFMFLLSEFYSELLGKHAGNPIPLTACLLDLIGSQGLCSLFTEKYAQEQVYPSVNALLGHPVAAVREIALKALQGLCEKLNAKTIGNDVLRQLARLQGDSEGSLRFKALSVLSGTVWAKLPDSLKAKICGPAVSRALADPFLPCRRSGLQLLKQGLSLLPPTEIATKLIPSIAGVLICEDAPTRAEAFECMEKLILPTLKRAMMGAGVKNDTGGSKEVKIPSTNANANVSANANARVNPVAKPVSRIESELVNSTESPPISDCNSPSMKSEPSISVGNVPGKMRLGSIKKII